ncbi:hypothetical protein ASG31_01780 [Chryseobacterium sp. Leaf404]|nr:hypothetical protein ASG31_01780 [Chryseobacterium sp. Leaf404]
MKKREVGSGMAEVFALQICRSREPAVHCIFFVAVSALLRPQKKKDVVPIRAKDKITFLNN